MNAPVRVLVVEDSPDDAELMILELSRGGFEPDWRRVETADEMRVALGAGPWDVILCDYTLPGFGGLEALAAARGGCPDVPFVLVSGAVGEDVAVEAMRAGANDYVLKHSLARLGPAVGRELREAGNRRERRRAEEAFRASEGRFRAVVEKGFEAVVLGEPGGRLAYASPASAHVLGCGPEELIGRDVFTLLHPEDRPGFKRLWDDLLRKPGALMTSTHRTLRGSGEWRWVQTRCGNLLGDPAVRAVVINFRDVTDQKEAIEGLTGRTRELQRALESVKQLQGLIPICAWCKKVRDDGDYWHEVEHYVATHSDASFTHSVCPPCMGRMLPGGSERGAARGRVGGPSAGAAARTEAGGRPPFAVLCVDDNADNLLSTAVLLRCEGYRVLEASTGAEALALAGGADLVVLDVCLPDLDGFEVCRRLRADPGTALLPIVMLSGHFTHGQDKALGLEGGGDVYLTKPAEPEVLLGQVKTLLRVRRAELDLSGSEERYRGLLDGIPQAVWTTQTDGTPDYFNRQWLGYTGLTLPESLAAGCWRAVHPDDLPSALGRWVQALREGGPYEAEYRLRRADGEYRWHVGRALPLRDGAGRVVRWCGTCTDVDEQKQAQRQMARSMEALAQLAAIVRSSEDAIISKSLDGVITSWNPAAERLYGWSAAEAIGRHISFLLPTERVEELDAILRRLRRDERVEHFESVRLHKDGTRIDVPLTLSLVRDAEGRQVGFSKIARDVRDRIRAQQEAARQAEALRQSEERHRALIDTIPHVVWMTRPDGSTDHMNRRGAERLGLPAEAAHGWGWLDLLHPDDAGRARLAWEAAVREGTPYQIEYRVRQSGGDYRWTLAQAVPVSGPGGEVERWVGTWTDVDEQRRAAEAVRGSEARFRAVVENSWDGVTLLDADGVIRYASPATRRVLGYAPEEYIGRAGAEFVHPDDLPAVTEVMAGVASAPGGSAILSYRYRHKNGSWLRVETAATNLLDAPHVRAVVLNSRDVTEALAATEALRRSEEQHRALAESIPNLVWVYRPTGIPEYFNRRWTEYTGASAEDLAAGTQPEIVHPDDRPRMQEVWERALRNGHLYEIEYRLRRADGAYRWHIGRAVPVRDPEGRVVRWFGTCTDIHDGRLAEDERSRLARHIRLLLESTDEGIYGLDHEGRCTFINRAGAAMLGHTPEELLGREMHPIIHHHRPGGAPYPSDECPIYTAFREGRGVRVEDESFWRKDGTAFPVSYTSYPAAEGGFRGAVVTFQDVTERKRAEEEREKFVALVEHSADFIAMADLDSRLLYVNPAGRRMVGLDPAAEVRGHRIDEFVPPDVAALYRETAIPQALAGTPWVGEARFTQFKTGQLLDMQQCVFVVRKPGGREPLCLATVARDVTGAKRLEEQYRQAQKMEAIGQLAGGVAHDFNNLLTIISGSSDLLLQSMPPDDPSRSLVEEIHRAGERSAALTRQLLVFSRKQVVAPKILDLNEVVADAEKFLRRIIGEDVRLETALRPLAGRVKADAGQMEQILLNLVVNARDAMPRGGRLTIETADTELDEGYARLHAGAQPGPYVVLAVSDTGCGMTQEVKARIFEPFFTTKEAGKGTGLGLAVVHGVVEQAGGHVGVYSEVGKGTTFRVYLPRVDQSARSGKSLSGVRPAPRGTETVLLVEDEDGVRALARHVLAGCGYSILEAGDGSEALRVAGSHRGTIHLLVTDVVMPGLGGRPLAERLQALHPGMKVLYVSGYTDDAVVRHGILEEQVQFLQKPFSPVALAFKAREVLDECCCSGSPTSDHLE